MIKQFFWITGTITSNASTGGTSSSSTLLNGLIAYYKLDETTGSVAYDQTSYHRDGAITASGVTVNSSGNLKITIPEPPFAAFAATPPPPPPPVLAVPLTAAIEL
jgi:hypothetical protein